MCRKTELEQDFDSTTRNSYDELIKRAEEKIMNINENCLPEGDLKQKSLVTGRIITIFLLGSTIVTEVYIFFEKSPNPLAN